jgi:hypothetical protein
MSNLFDNNGVLLSDLTNPKLLKALYASRTSLAFEGPPGIGKSDVIRSLPEILSGLYGEKFGYAECLAPSLDAPDVRGFLIPTKDEHGRAVARYTYPAIMPSPEYLAAHPRGIAFVDEFGQADHAVAKSLAPFILEGAIGDYKLPPGWWVITASNRVSDRSGVVKPLMHLINRQRKVNIIPSLNGWKTWAIDAGVHPMGVSFAMQHPAVVFSAEVPADPRPFCSPRSFVSAMRYMQEVAGSSMNLPSDPVTQEFVTGDIGTAAAAAFFAYIKVAEHLPEIEDVKRNPSTAKLPPPERLDAVWAVQQMCIYHADAEFMEPIWEYMMRLPRDMQVSTAQTLMNKRNSGVLLNSKSFAKWITENKALIINTTA